MKGPARPKFAFVVAVMLGAALAGSPAPAQGTCTTPPEVFPVDQLQKGMTGTALTVVEGRDPESFDVEVLGVQPDGIAPGVDFVLVKLSGPVIDRTGGIAFGMSGSPVTIQGKLAGALAFGFFAADQTIAGMTPAQPMVDLFGYPQATAQAAQARSVRLSPALRRAAARAGDTWTASDFAVARRLLLPVAISGLGDDRVEMVNDAFDRARLPLFAYRAGSAQPTQAVAPLRPGDAFAGTFSYGDVTFAGIGTATAVCGDRVVAFGHPFFFDGETLMGMNGADIVTTVRDPSSIFGAFKIGNVTELHGAVDQDRLAGIRGIEGAQVPLIPITSHTENPDLGNGRDGRTDVVRQEFLSFLAFFHLLVNQDVAFDEIGEGSLDLSWTIRGLRESGEPFEFTRDNVFFNEFDVSLAGLLELDSMLSRIVNNPFEDLTVTGVEADETITAHELRSTITRVEVATGAQDFQEVPELRVRAGSTVRARVFLQPAGGGPEESFTFLLQVPRRAEGRSRLVIRGGASTFDTFGFFFGDGEPVPEPAPEPGSLDELLLLLGSTERNSDLIGMLRGRRLPVEVRQVEQRGEVVQGRHVIRLVVVR